MTHEGMGPVTTARGIITSNMSKYLSKSFQLNIRTICLLAFTDKIIVNLCRCMSSYSPTFAVLPVLCIVKTKKDYLSQAQLHLPVILKHTIENTASLPSLLINHSSPSHQN